jgi:hypothetical protein
MGGPLRSSSLPPRPVAFYAGDNDSIVLRLASSKACTPPTHTHAHKLAHTLFFYVFDVKFYANCWVTFARLKLN